MRQEVIGQEVSANRARPKTPPRRRRSPVVIWLQVLIALTVLAAVSYGLWQTTAEQADEAFAVPGQIGGYQLADVYRGQEAMAELKRLHGKDIGLSGGWIGYYQDKAVAWVGAVQNEGQAFQLLDAMNRRIGAGNGPFTNLQQLQFDGQTVFTVVGQGQRHYYYQRGKLVIWLAAPGGGEERFLKDALKLIR